MDTILCGIGTSSMIDEMDFFPLSTRRNLLLALDGPCSALALNCCQFACCNRRKSCRYREECNNQITLRDIVLPGTHNTGSFSIPAISLFSAVGRTQNWTVWEQLERGARYLDVRVADGHHHCHHGLGRGNPDGSDVTIWHGCLMGGPLPSVLNQLVTFLREHSGKFVVVEIVPEFGREFSPARKLKCLNILRDALGDMIYQSSNRSKPTDLNILFHQTALSHIIQKEKKQCLILLHERFYDDLADTPTSDGNVYNHDYIAKQFGFYRSDVWMNNRWYNTRNVSQLLQWNLKEVKEQRFNGQDRSRLLQNQFVLTPGVGAATDILELLVGRLSVRPVSLALQLYQSNRLDDYMRHHAHQPWNVVTLDYMDLVPGFIAFLISLNFAQYVITPVVGHKTRFAPLLQIKFAAVHKGTEGKSMDVTDKIQDFMFRGCVLYLTDVARDLALPFSKGRLALIYRFVCSNASTVQNQNESEKSSMVWHVKQVSFGPCTKVLLGTYTQNPGPSVAMNIEQGGMVIDGQLYPESSNHPTSNRCVIRYGDSLAGPVFHLVN